MELAPGVHALPIEFGDDRTIHPAAVATDRGVLLLDVGLDADALAGALADAGLALADARLVLLTHQDPDHCGALAAVVDRTGALVAAHEAAAPAIAGERDLVKGDPDGDRYPPVPVDVEVVDGVGFRTPAGPMRVVHTPGHAPGHVSLYLPDERLLLAADAVTAADGALASPTPRFTPDPATARESVARLADLDVERVLCYHGGAVDADGDDLAAVADGMAD